MYFQPINLETASFNYPLLVTRHSSLVTRHKKEISDFILRIPEKFVTLQADYYPNM